MSIAAPASSFEVPKPASAEERALLEVYQEIFNRCVLLSVAKSADYGDMTPAKDTYFPFGAASYAHMLHTKTMRVVNLVKKAQTGGEPNFEGLDDSLEDLLNYTMFFLAYRRKT